MIRFRCPHCGLETNTDPKFAGQTGPCAGCGRPITIPLPLTSTSPGSPVRPTRRTRVLGTPSRHRLLTVGGLALVCAILLSFGWGITQMASIWIRNSRQTVQQRRCHANMAEIMKAWLAYHADHGTYPPAYSVDRNGRPLHSWRVLILPYLGSEHAAVAQRIHLDEPWDSPHNSQFHAQIPPLYACPSAVGFAPGDTHYLGIEGPACILEAANPKSAADIQDGADATICVLEAGDSGINWMEPRDLTRTALLAGLNSGATGTPGCHHGSGEVTAGLASGRVVSLSSQITPDELVGLATVGGGEPVPPALD